MGNHSPGLHYMGSAAAMHVHDLYSKGGRNSEHDLACLALNGKL